MTEYERTGLRSLVYSTWHRTPSLSRYLPREWAHECAMVDLDGIEYCRRCWQPVGLVEIARDNGQQHKSTAVMRACANKLDVPALLVFYTPNDDDSDIVAFRVRWIVSARVPPEFRSMFGGELQPATYAELIHWLHARHVSECKG